MSGLEDFTRLRLELFEIDAQFSQLTCGGGLFAALDEAGALDHRVPEVGDIERARTEPPPGGRAEQRSRWVRRLHDCNGYSCSWIAVRGRRGKTIADLSDPFGEDAA